jgi:hypothetical protein
VQTPFTQACAPHDLPHIPQLSGSEANVPSHPSAAFALQFPKPGRHTKLHRLPLHVAAAFGGAVHTTQPGPHAVGSFGPTHVLLQACVAPLHFTPQASFTHVATPPGGTGHAMHAGPQAAGSVFATHAPAQAWNCDLQVNVQTPRAQSTEAFITGGHFRLQPPQLFALVRGSTHSPPHRRGAAGAQPFVHWNDPPTGVQSGAVTPQIALQAPQLVAFDRSISQPSAGFMLQSAKPGSQLPMPHWLP